MLQGTINRLEQEKGKLENYAKRTLTAFKDKYMAALQGMKQEKRNLEERLALVTAKSEHNQETSRREERLLISAMYEVSENYPRHRSSLWPKGIEVKFIMITV